MRETPQLHCLLHSLKLGRIYRAAGIGLNAMGIRVLVLPTRNRGSMARLYYIALHCGGKG